MTPELLFKIANTAGLLVWIYLIAAARWTPRVFRIVRWAFPIAIAVGYIFALFMTEPNEDAGFTTLAGVTALFAQPWGVVAGWLHYLAFDFFVGCWILATAKKKQIGHWLIVVPLILTFMLGPVGLLVFLAILGFRGMKRRSGQTS